MDFEKTCMLFTMQEPFYGVMLSSMNRISEPAIGTIGVVQDGNVFKLYYNPDFVNNLPQETVLELLKHEMLHCAFNHFSIWSDDNHDDTDAVHDMENIACDLEINCYLKRDRIDKAAGGVFCEDFGFDKNLGSREYFKKLLDWKKQKEEEKEKQQAAGNPDKECNGGQGGENSDEQNQQNQQGQQNAGKPSQNGSGEPNRQQQKSDIPEPDGNSQDSITKDLASKLLDNHSIWKKPENEEQAKMIQQNIDELLAFAADEAEKKCGSLPGELVGKITEIRKERKPKPVADWKRYFRRYIGNEFTDFIRKSKKRESRRFPDAAGNRHKRKSHILVAIDTSGSVSMPEYREFFGQIRTLTSSATFHVVECDARIQFEYDYKGKCNETLHGHGGTDFQPVITMFNENKRKYDALIYFTDGEARIPKDTPKETLWVVSSKGDQKDPNKYKVNGAAVAFIPKPIV